MTYAILFGAQARSQLAEAMAWILANRGAERARVLGDELAAGLGRIQERPALYRLLPGSRSVRRLRLARSGYHVYYRVVDRQALILVTRIRHERRRPVRW